MVFRSPASACRAKHRFQRCCSFTRTARSKAAAQAALRVRLQAPIIPWLLIMGPHADDLHHFFILVDLIYQPELNVDAACIGSR